MSSKLTPQNQASLVLDLINYDLRAHRWNESQKLDYLKIIGDHVDDVGEDLLSAPVGEDRPEASDTDILIVDKGAASLIDLLFEITRPDGEDALNPVQFMKSGECIKGDDAISWLYVRKYTEESNHIHVFPCELCLDLAGDNPRWIEPDGVKSAGKLSTVLTEMYCEYRERKHAET